VYGSKNFFWASAALTAGCDTSFTGSCDGTFTMTVNFCTAFAFQSTPSLSIKTRSINVLVFKNVCSGTYQLDILGGELCGQKHVNFTMPVNTKVPTELFDKKENINLF